MKTSAKAVWKYQSKMISWSWWIPKCQYLLDFYMQNLPQIYAWHTLTVSPDIMWDLKDCVRRKQRLLFHPTVITTYSFFKNLKLTFDKLHNVTYAKINLTTHSANSACDNYHVKLSQPHLRIYYHRRVCKLCLSLAWHNLLRFY